MGINKFGNLVAMYENMSPYSQYNKVPPTGGIIGSQIYQNAIPIIGNEPNRRFYRGFNKKPKRNDNWIL